MRTAIFPGSFDPITFGHLNIIARGVKLFDHLVVAILINPGKQSLFTAAERLSMLEETLSSFANTAVTSCTGLTAVFAEQLGAEYLLRGIRGEADFSYELPMLLTNKQIYPKLETVLLAANPELAHISSSMVRQVAAVGYREAFDDDVLDKWVPPVVKAALKQKYCGL